MDNERIEGPLTGVQVLEVGGGYAAAAAARWLAGYGADVARTEGPPEALDQDQETYLLAGKSRIEVDDAELRRLALAADIVVEDQRPGALASRGLGPEDLRREKPELIVTSISPCGQQGPYAQWEHTNITTFALGGIMGLTGDPARPPLQTGGQQALALAGINAACATITAYYGALVQGEGDWLDISMQECAAGILELYGARTEYEGSGPSIRTGNSVSAVWGIYEVADGYGGVCCLQRQIPAFFKVVGEPELLTDRFMDPQQRLENDDELRAYLIPWFLERTKGELLELGAEHRIPFGAVLTPADLLGSETLAERDYFDEVETNEGTARLPGRPVPGLGWRGGALSRPGADTDAVRERWLGGAR